SAWSPMEDWDAIEPLNQALRAAARAVDSLAFAESVRATQRLARPLIAMFENDFDVLVTPTMSVPPPPVGAWREGMTDDPWTGLMNCFPMAVFTSIFNVTGLPALSLPVHQSGAACRSACRSSRAPGAKTACCNWERRSRPP